MQSRLLTETVLGVVNKKLSKTKIFYLIPFLEYFNAFNRSLCLFGVALVMKWFLNFVLRSSNLIIYSISRQFIYFCVVPIKVSMKFLHQPYEHSFKRKSNRVRWFNLIMNVIIRHYFWFPTGHQAPIHHHHLAISPSTPFISSMFVNNMSGARR